MDDPEVDPKRSSIKACPVYSSNPFVPTDITFKSNENRPGKLAMLTMDGLSTPINIQLADTSVKQWRDKKPYVKVFQESTLQMGKLTTPALRLLCYILFNLKPNKDWIFIDIDQYLSLSGYSDKVNKNNQRNRAHYYKAVVELINESYLGRKNTGDTHFFINSNKFYNGDRTLPFKQQQD